MYGDRRAVEPLLRVAGTDASLAVRAAAAYALSGGFNEVRAVAPLLQTVLRGAHGDRSTIDAAIIPALAHLTNPYWHNPRMPLPASSIPPLIEAVVTTGSMWVRSWAATALRYVATPDDRVIAILQVAQQDTDVEVRRAADESLRVLSTKGLH